ncbi:unnamed protein product [Timema podura]|uniref:Palmitoyltransferase n=1 Tax=Timema podura TaxID=61482 RepID=A0ABN7NLQ0_TIMPD|nr:unnamed protein product [Timema podura]
MLSVLQESWRKGDGYKKLSTSRHKMSEQVSLTAEESDYEDQLFTRTTPDRDSNPDIPVIGSPVYCESDTLDHSTTELVGHLLVRLVVCERVPVERIAGIMSTFQDRLRVPWRGGAKQISMDSLLPIVLQPLLAYIACTERVVHAPVPLMEILPEENFVLIVFVVAALACAYKVRSRAPLNHVPHTDPADATGMVGNGKATEEVCSVCRKRVPPRTFHCRICQACVTKRDHHCVWFDCCVGEHNHLLFVLSLLLSVLALVYGAILTLTTVCHPIFFMDVILLPDDCSDVYHDFQ